MEQEFTVFGREPESQGGMEVRSWGRVDMHSARLMSLVSADGVAATAIFFEIEFADPNDKGAARRQLWRLQTPKLGGKMIELVRGSDQHQITAYHRCIAEEKRGLTGITQGRAFYDTQSARIVALDSDEDDSDDVGAF